MNDELKAFEQEIYKKIIAGKKLSKNELSAVICCFKVDEDVQTIVRINDKHYAIDWRRGLTENQDNSYGNQPYEVLKRTKTVTDWVPVSWEQNEDEDEDY
ncbi:hypothetical protein [Snodgrassella alvi]|uniref:Uncharacterized protein n=1 Tax=Snodgrassella alvi TaxID=1196083 RepID=A0A2N9XXH8_9NEIS|nr:hypothetical protein [Snodgrassella alvi]PIT54690.1 hypothetical protein BHC49_07615 [Snodgrassella alvi]